MQAECCDSRNRTLRQRKVCDCMKTVHSVLEETVFRATLEGVGLVPKERVDFFTWETPYEDRPDLWPPNLGPMPTMREFDPQDSVPSGRWRGPLGLAMTDLVRWDPGPVADALKNISRLEEDELFPAIQDLSRADPEGFDRLRKFCRRWHIELNRLGIATMCRALDFRKLARAVLEEHARMVLDLGRTRRNPGKEESRGLYFPLLSANEWQDLLVASTASKVATPPRRIRRVWDSRWLFDFVQLCRWELFHHFSRNVSVRRCRLCECFTLVEVGRVFDCWWCRRTTGTAKQRSRKAARDKELRKLSQASLREPLSSRK